MTDSHLINLMDVDVLIQTFLQERESGIATLHRLYFKTSNVLSLRALKEELMEELRTGCVSFLNKGSPMEELDNYLFYIVNAFCKRSSVPSTKQQVEYVCPGCVFLDKEYSVLTSNKVLKCDECTVESKSCQDPQRLHLFSTFATHNKQGYHCPDCQRFIPHPLDQVSKVFCPYFDCLFAGSIDGLHKMLHPTSKTSPEKLILDVRSEKGFCLKDSLSSTDMGVHVQMEIAEDLRDKLAVLQEIIETQSNNVPYSSSNATIKHKQFVYQAFSNLLTESPSEMIGYLLNSTDNHLGFQHRIFQEYIRLLEASLPFFVTKHRKPYKVDSLLDNTLCLFDGISVFDAVVTDQLSIKNGTKEFYIGGRKATYAKPYYIGKLLNIVHRDTKTPLTHLVKDYSFSKVRMQDIEPETPVTVTHLRVPPHYQMGGMAYVNRIRKKIVDRARTVIQ